MAENLKPLRGAGSVGRSRQKWVYERGIPELIEAYENRQISLHRADIVAHLIPENQREELKKLVAGKDKITVLPMTEELLLKQKRLEQMQTDARDGLTEFQREFKQYWLRLERKHGWKFTEGEMWRSAESVIIGLDSPGSKSANQ